MQKLRTVTTPENDVPMLLTARCCHWWRRRIGIPITGPIVYGPTDEEGRPRYIQLAPQVPFCRRCASQLSMADMTPMTTDQVAAYLGLEVIDDEAARSIANDWQGTALQHYASTGTVTDELEHEIRQALEQCMKGGDHQGQDDLQTLGRYLGYW